MIKLCKDCKYVMYDAPYVKEGLVARSDGPWCEVALNDKYRGPDLHLGGLKPFTSTQVADSEVKVQRSYPIVLDWTERKCGSRGRWFELKEQKWTT